MNTEFIDARILKIPDMEAFLSGIDFPGGFCGENNRLPVSRRFPRDGNPGKSICVACSLRDDFLFQIVKEGFQAFLFVAFAQDFNGQVAAVVVPLDKFH